VTMPTILPPSTTGTLLMAALHQPHDIFQRRILRHRPHFFGHDIANFAAADLNVLVRKPAGTEKKLHPLRSMALGAGFGAAQEVAFADDADQIALIVDNGKAADFLLQHHPRGYEYGFVRRH
jgi:hypothetical protein